MARRARLGVAGRRREGERFAVVEAATRTVVGSCTLGLKNREHGTAIAGCWPHKNRWGLGHASEVAILLCHNG